MDPGELRAKLDAMWDASCDDPCEFANGWCAAVDELRDWLDEVGLQ